MENNTAQLNRIEQQQKETLWILRGEEDMGIEGVLPTMKRLDNDVRSLTEWRKEQDLMKKLRRERLIASLKFAGGLGAVITFILGLFEFYSQIMSP